MYYGTLCMASLTANQTFRSSSAIFLKEPSDKITTTFTTLPVISIYTVSAGRNQQCRDIKQSLS